MCKAETCFSKAHAKGYCPTHLARFNKGQDINAPVRAIQRQHPKYCTLEDCKRLYSAKGMCGFHYKRQQTGVRIDKPYLGYNRSRATKNCLTCSKEFTVQYSLRKAQFCSYSCKGKVKIGARNPNWKGGITGEDREERNRFNRELRNLILARDNYTCQICNKEANHLQIDHIKRWSKFPELRFNMDNCRTVCVACHYYVTYKRKMPSGSKWSVLYKSQEIGILDLQ